MDITIKHFTSFKHKLYTGLPTKNSMVSRFGNCGVIANKSRVWNNKLAVKASDSCCVMCGAEIVEDTTHIFMCPSKVDSWNLAANKIVTKFNKIFHKEYNTLPFWFPTTKRVWAGTSEAVVELLNFDKSWGAWAVI